MARWAEGFRGYFPEGLSESDRYWNFKLPVLQGFVDGKHTTQAVRRECAQRLIDACSHLIQSKPEEAKPFRVVAAICWPGMFASEVCIYTSEDVFQDQVQTWENEFGSVKTITGKSFAQEWGLALPAGFHERGLEVHGMISEDVGWFTFEQWLFGEVL
ncbi:MAG TPA: DUF3916 domain-containing protein [Thermoanaerobaculia bacterium]|nr:DUF3916 domain-containing protein [Thermoanaerobaculia bacterium]